MPAPAAAEAHYRAQQRLAASTLLDARRLWFQLDPVDLTRSWARVGPRLHSLVTSAQLRAATDGASFVPQVLDEQGIDASSVAEVRPASLAGVASSGAPLDEVLYTPVIRAKQAAAGRTGLVGLHQPPGPALLDAGLPTLEGIVLTQIADAARAAVGIGTIASPHAHGYVRMLNPPSCSRCAILAGRVYRAKEPFQRHPRCDCRHIPTSEALAGDLTTDTGAYFASLNPADQDRIFTRAGAQAIRDGADINQVVNARRGMTAAGTTSEGATVRRRAGRRGPRLMPERIYEQAATRDEAIELLRRHGYLT